MSAGEQMAESGKQKAGGVPEGWEYSSPEKLRSPERNALTIGPFGSNLLASDYTDSGVPLVFVREIRSRNFSLPTSKFVSQEKAEELRAHSVKPGDILITKMGDPPGDVAIYPNGPTAIITADCIKLTVDNSIANNCFVANALQTSEFRARLAEITSGVAQQKVSLERFRHLPILLPPLPEQRKIAAILSTWDDSLATLTNLLAAKRQQKRGLAEALLTGKKRLPGFEGEWRKEKLSKYVTRTKGKIAPTNKKGLGVPYIGAKSFGGNFEDFTEEVSAVICIREDVLILWDGEYAGNSTTGLEGAVSSTVARLRLSSELNPVFLQSFLQHDIKAIRESRTGSGIPHMPSDFEKWYVIPVPPLPEQQAIASILSALDGEIASLEALKAKVQEQKRGLMDELLTGRIRVRVQE